MSLNRYNAIDRIADVCAALEPIAANAQCPEQERILGLAIHCLKHLNKDFSVISRQLKERNEELSHARAEAKRWRLQWRGERFDKEDN